MRTPTPEFQIGQKAYYVTKISSRGMLALSISRVTVGSIEINRMGIEYRTDGNNGCFGSGVLCHTLEEAEERGEILLQELRQVFLADVNRLRKDE